MSDKGQRKVKVNNEATNKDSGQGIASTFFQAEEQFQNNRQEVWRVQKGRSRKNRQVAEGSKTKLDFGDHSRSSAYETREKGNKRPPQNQKEYNKRPYQTLDTDKTDFSKPHNNGNRQQKQNSYQSCSGPSSNVTERSKKQDKNKEFNFGFSYTRLNQLSIKDSTDIIRNLANSRSGLDEFLKGNIKPDCMFLIIKILSKLTTSDWDENKEHVLIKATPPEFFKKITEFVMCLVTDSQSYKRLEEIEQFFENLLTFYRAILTVLPTVAAEHLTGPLRITKMAMENVTEFQNVTISAGLFDRLKELMFDFEERKKEKEERDRVIRERTEPIYPKTLGDVKEIPIYPRPQDMARAHGFIVPNIIKGPYSNVQHYLDVQFHLLREDFIAPVRQGIHEFKMGNPDKKCHEKKRVSNIRIYRRVKFLKPKVISDKVGYDICFDPEKRLKIKWEFSKRFIFGSLLLFTTDNFHTFFLATVVKRDLSELEKDRIVSVILCDTNELAQDILSKEFLMAESEVYFEPYYTVLKALQKFNNDTFPMKKYFVYVETKTDRPAYTRNGSDVYSISVGDSGIGGRKTIRLFDTHTWPTCEELGFDSSQLNAFKAALTNDLVVIQGPPGTGKTYIGLKIAAALLENSIIWNYDHKTPILVICYTNHALDQFLSGIIQKNLTNNVVRIGGRSKSELLEPFNLKERRKAIVYYNRNFDQASLLQDLKKEMSKIFENIKILQDNLEHLDNNEGILSLKTLKIVMSEFHQKYFRNNDDLLEWLLLGVNQQVRSQKKLISTNDKGVKRQSTTNMTDDFGLDLPDFENVTRLKEVLFDSIDLEEPTNDNNNDEILIYYSYTLEEIAKKIEEYARVFESLPNSEGDRKSIQQKMHEVKNAENDLKLIFLHFEGNLKKTGIPTEEETKLFTVKDVNTLNSSERWLLYKSWVEFLKAGYWMMIGKSEEQFRRGARRYDEVRQFDDLTIVQQADVVGITTTTAARLQSMLRELKPKIVIVEEAAEVMESHIVASLSVSCQHLILIGDHKQLRPSPSEYRLAKEYHLDVSLFERLINNGINYHTLGTQHRMRPEISRLIVPTIYPSLSDHPSTLNRQHVRGMDKSVFFMTHNHFEEEVDDNMSKKNLFEARMVMLLARHLLLQGYRPDEITVLATYSGQMYLMKEEQRRLEISNDLLVTAVDNYQGEENRIILLSLVRSNAHKKIGFLMTENRVCVALSRARDGLFLIGNMDCLAAESVLWQRIRQSFVDQSAFGPALILRCEMHRNQLTRIINHSDFNSVIEGGCSQSCGETLACGHNCKSLCHVSKDRHTKYRCSEPCNRFLCSDKHLCAKKCYQDCGECVIPMERTLACGHKIMLPCSVNYGKLQCKELVNVRYPNCNHEVQLECFRSVHKTCTKPCLFRLDCGHACTKTCHVTDDPDHLQYVCEKACARRPLGCTTDTHKCPLKCYEECQPCTSKVVRQLQCGHSLTTLCRDKNLLCRVPCSRKLGCGHPCKNMCFENCSNCNVKVEKMVPLCGHKIQIACSEVPTKNYCKGQCAVRLQCGHRCAKRCCDPCRREDCVVPTKLTMGLPCGHKGALLPCNLTANIDFVKSDAEQLVQYCSEPCLQTLKCTHLCSGTCGECMQGRIHKVCDEDCGNTLICGHSCPVPCRQVCPPCEKSCQNRCVHTKCPKKCGEPCVPCKELCEYKCVHSRCTKRCGDLCNKKPCTEPCYLPLPCSHPCVGFCGEPCPPCKLCFPEHYEEFFFTGEETEEDAKWVLLNDCKHVIEVRILEHWLGMDQEGSEIKLKSCPKCRPTEPNRYISTTQRYMNLVKRTTMDIQAVKEKIFGQVEKIREERQKLLVEIQSIRPIEMEGFPVDKDENQLLLLHLRLLKELPVVRNQRRKEIDIEQLRVLIYMANYLTTVLQRKKEIWHQLNETTKSKMLTKINTLTEALRKREKKISNDEIESFDLELNRIVRFGDILILESSGEFRELRTNAEVIQCFKRAEKLITQFSRYTKDQDEKVLNAIQEVKKIIKSNAKLSAREMKEIHIAMSKNFYGGSSAQGHWFKCPNGHPYTITECGGAMEVAKCPIDNCGALIGGQDHRYLPGQQLFNEMDGATRPAWSSGNDMNNYNF